MFSKKKNKTFVTVLVVILGLGLVMAYVPLLFQPSLEPGQTQDINSETPQTASLTPPAPETTFATTSTATSTPTSTSASAPQTKKISPPDSFNGLQEEKKSLDDLNNLLDSGN